MAKSSTVLLLALLIHVVCYIGAKRYVARAILLPQTARPRHALSKPAYISYALTTTANVSLLILIVIQGFDWKFGEDRIISNVITGDLAVMVVTAWLLLPLVITYLFVKSLVGHIRWPLKILICVTVALSTTLSLSHLGTLVHAPRYSLSPQHIIARIAVAGVTLVSILAGYGSIQFPLHNLKMIFNPIDKESMREVERKLAQVMQERQSLIFQVESTNRQHHMGLALTPEGSKLIKRGFSMPPPIRTTLMEDADIFETTPDHDEESPSVSGRKNLLPDFASAKPLSVQDVNHILDQIQLLEKIADELLSLLSDMRTQHAKYLRSKTAKGKFMNLLAWIMVAACLYRVITALINVIFRRVSEVDPATNLLNALLQHANIELDVEIWAAYITLFYAGILVYTTIQSFSERVASLVRRAAFRCSPDLLTYILAEVQTLYFCSCALLLRTNLPQRHRSKLNRLFGQDLDFANFHLHFDLVFGMSCLASVFIAFFDQHHKKEQLRSAT